MSPRVAKLLTRRRSGLAIALFLVGLLLIPRLCVMLGLSGLNEIFSFSSGLFLALCWLSIAMFVDWWRSGKCAIGKVLLVLTLISVFCAVFFYPPVASIVSGFISVEYYLNFHSEVGMAFALLTVLSSVLVFLLGNNATCEEEKDGRSITVRFLLSLTTLISFVSVGVNFVLSSSDYSSAMGGSLTRVIIVGSYCLVPVASYSLGFLAKLLKPPVAEGLALSLSMILGFTTGAIVSAVIVFNDFVVSAGISLFLTIGIGLALTDRCGGVFQHK